MGVELSERASERASCAHINPFLLFCASALLLLFLLFLYFNKSTWIIIKIYIYINLSKYNVKWCLYLVVCKRLYLAVYKCLNLVLSASVFRGIYLRSCRI